MSKQKISFVILLALTLFSATIALSQDTFVSTASVGEKPGEHQDVSASKGLDTSHVVEAGLPRWMSVGIKDSERSYSSMRGGSAEVLIDRGPGSGSSWEAGYYTDGRWQPGGYGGKPIVLFRGLQNPNAEAKTYRPKFIGKVDIKGNGGGNKENWYEWSVVNADYKITGDVEIHRKVGNGEFKKISDTQNVDPVIVGQKVTLKVVLTPQDQADKIKECEWKITDRENAILAYSVSSDQATITKLPNDLKDKEFYYYHVTEKTSFNVTVNVKGPYSKDSAISKSAAYKIIAPSISGFKGTVTNELRPPAGCHGTSWLALGQVDPLIKGIVFSGEVRANENGAGKIGVIQLINTVRVNYYDIPAGTSESKKRIITTQGNDVLDVVQILKPIDGCVLNAKTITSGGTTQITHYDSPAQQIVMQHKTYRMPTSHKASVTERMKTYCVYKPDGGIWVPLEMISWGWKGTAYETFDSKKNDFIYLDEVPGTVTEPTKSKPTTPPVWNDNIQKIEKKPNWSEF